MKFGFLLILYFSSVQIEFNRADIEYLYSGDEEIVDKEAEHLSGIQHH